MINSPDEKDHISAQTQNMDVSADKQTENISPINKVLIGHLEFLKIIKRVGYGYLGLGVLEIFLGGTPNIIMGVLLSWVGLASFYIKTSPIMFVYSIISIWISLNFIAIGEPIFFVLGLFGLYSSVYTFKNYRLFKKVELLFFMLEARTIPPEERRTKRAEKTFPLIGFIFGVTTLISMVILLMYAGSMKDTLSQNHKLVEWFGFFYGLLSNLAVLGFATSTAAWLAKFKQKTITIIGMIFNTLVIFFLIIVKFVLPLIR